MDTQEEKLCISWPMNTQMRSFYSSFHRNEFMFVPLLHALVPLCSFRMSDNAKKMVYLC